MSKEFTSLYVSVTREDDAFIDSLRLEKISSDKKHYNKNDIVKMLIYLGMDVIKGRYLELDQSVDAFVSKLQELVVEMDGEKVIIKKSKQQVYSMIIEKGLQHLND